MSIKSHQDITLHIEARTRRFKVFDDKFETVCSVEIAALVKGYTIHAARVVTNLILCDLITANDAISVALTRLNARIREVLNLSEADAYKLCTDGYVWAEVPEEVFDK
jgi:hypothetical protein